MKFKYFIVTIATISIIILIQFYIKGKNADSNWINDLNYEKNQIHDISIGLLNPCPSTLIKIGNKEFELLFDMGNGVGITITTALEGKVDYEIIGKTTELNSDGTYRGEGSSILLKSIDVLILK